MGAIGISCFTRDDVFDQVCDVATSVVPCGIGNVFYNKVFTFSYMVYSDLIGRQGAVALACTINGVKFAFICAHLPAHDDKVKNFHFLCNNCNVVSRYSKEMRHL
jgi:hypothetical protein